MLHFGHWDNGARTHSQALLRANQVLAEAARIQPHDRVLDMGCGEGSVMLWLAERYGNRATGITICEDQARRGRQVVQENRLSHLVDVEHMDYLNTSFTDGEFDVVWMQDSVTHAEDLTALFTEAHRVLKPGGRLVAEDGLRKRATVDHKGSQLLARLSDGLVATFPYADEALEIVEQAGFTNVVLRDVTKETWRTTQIAFAIAALARPALMVMRRLNSKFEVLARAADASTTIAPLIKRDMLMIGLITATKPQTQDSP
nr:gamma-tocopherol methyltransferase @ delta-tocopherol methyltransferase [Kibdelosporangium sp. MJ126-NF4]CTQ99103.1 gamma-tocopherol methyltransferase (EC 2.1.1.95) @ delta-tocopherol methyltransferase (EC 2.1.1.95) [Kibdelosporangium sp. MJ126-NF4]